MPCDGSNSAKSWFAEGLRFQCTGCGKCCTGAPGFIWVDNDEINAIADLLGMDTQEFCRSYVRHVDNKRSLIEKKTPTGDYDCIFLKDKKCQIYPVRPSQCRTYPWWVHNLTSEKAWAETAAECEGINHPDAPLITAVDILKRSSSP
jgi:Fe-S-cluster containining protein